MSSEKLEEFLETPDDKLDIDTLIENIQSDKNIDLSKSEVYISNTDKFFISIENALKKQAQSTKWNFNITPKFHYRKLDGFFLSFSKKF